MAENEHTAAHPHAPHAPSSNHLETPQVKTQAGRSADAAPGVQLDRPMTHGQASWIEHVLVERNESLASSGGFERIARALHEAFPRTRFTVREHRHDVGIHYIANLPNAPSNDAVRAVLNGAAPTTTWKIPKFVWSPPDEVKRHEIRAHVMELLETALTKKGVLLSHSERVREQVRQALDDFVAKGQTADHRHAGYTLSESSSGLLPPEGLQRQIGRAFDEFETKSRTLNQEHAQPTPAEALGNSLKRGLQR